MTTKAHFRIPLRPRAKARFFPAALIAAALCFLVAYGAFAQQQASGGVFAVSDGHGQISLMWFPQPDRWPMGGWRVEDSSGAVVAAHVQLGDPDALKALPDADAQSIQSLPQTLRSPDATGQRRELLFGILAINALGNPAYARALGVAWSAQGVAAGQRTYRVIALDPSGRTTGLVLTSASVDSSIATPPPAAPANLSAQIGRDGISLLWSPSTGTPDDPVIAYDVTRDDSAAKSVDLTPKPLVLGTKWNAKAPVYADRGAPSEQMLSYHVTCVDVFGRHGSPADVRIFLPDLAALDPPEPVTAAAGAGGVTISWSPGTNPHTAGYVVERALLYDGPYEALTPQGLTHDTKQYIDPDVRGGTAYYYRVRAVGPRGDLGTPSHSAMVQPKNAVALPKPAHLVADLGATRVRLTWTPVPFPVAGYFVQRLGANASVASSPRAASAVNAAQWVQLNARPTPEALYDDFFGNASSTKFSYRVIAVGYDNAQSPPSDSVSVTLPDNSLPGIPEITAADGSGGAAKITFSPGLPAEDTAQFLVMRGGSADDLGVVIGDPLPGSAREFTDHYVEPGNDYWYRLVALDSHGNRSDPTPPVVIRVGAPSIPTPPAPAAVFARDPSPQARLTFTAPPAGLAVMVQIRVGDGGQWIALAGPFEGQTQFIDSNPPDKDPVFYRIVYRSESGAYSSPSDAAQLHR